MILKISSIGLGFSWIDGSSCKVRWNTWLPPTSTSQPLSCHNVWMLFKMQQQWTFTYVYIYILDIILYIHSQWWPWAWIGTQYTSYNCSQSVRKIKKKHVWQRGCQMVLPFYIDSTSNQPAKKMVRTHPMSRTRCSQITGQHWRMMSSLFLSTGAVQLVPGAVIWRGVFFGHRMVFAGSFLNIGNPGCHRRKPQSYKKKLKNLPSGKLT